MDVVDLPAPFSGDVAQLFGICPDAAHRAGVEARHGPPPSLAGR